MKATPSLLAVLALSALSSCVDQPSSPPPSQGPVYRKNVSSQSLSSLEEKVYQEVNAYRIKIGAPPLQRLAGMDKLANEHSQFLRVNRGKFSVYGKNVSHYGSEARAFRSARLFRMMDYSENVAAFPGKGNAAGDARLVVSLWQNSEGHDYAMRNPTWTHTGIGVIKDADGLIFITQVFGAQQGGAVNLARQQWP